MIQTRNKSNLNKDKIIIILDQINKKNKTLIQIKKISKIVNKIIKIVQ